MKPVLFVTGLGERLDRAENMRAIYEAYQGEKKIMWAGDPEYANEIGSGKYGLQVIDVFPTFKAAKTIMTWHAIQGGKHIGLDQKGTYYRREMADFMDYIIVAGKGAVDMFHQCTGVPKERILNLGMARTDRRFIQTGEKNVGKIYLFAPTFRGKSDVPMPEIDWRLLDSMLADNEILYVKPHPYGNDFDLKGCRHIKPVDKLKPSDWYLRSADVIITDYSSIIFDGYLMGIPSVLFEKEKGYVENRGMYLKYPEQYSSWYCTNEKDLIKAVRTAYQYGLTEIERDCMDIVADMCDGHSCERICKFIEGVNT